MKESTLLVLRRQCIDKHEHIAYLNQSAASFADRLGILAMFRFANASLELKMVFLWLAPRFDLI